MSAPKYGTPTGRVRYDDASVSGKDYVHSDAQSMRVKTVDAPFKPSFLQTLFGRTKVTPTLMQKRPMTVSSQHAFVPVTDESGKRFHAHFFDVQYHPDGVKPAVVKSDGSVMEGNMPFMMAPGMKKMGTGQYDPFQVPADQMSRKPSDFSYFTPIEDPNK